MKLHDQHVHTNYSPDSKTSIKEYLDLAEELKLENIVFTDHCDYDALFDSKDHIVNQDKLRSEVNSLKDKYTVDILFGVEMGYRKTYINEINKYLKENSFDIVLLSVHDVEVLDYYFPEKYSISPDEFIESYFKLYLEAMNHVEDYDVVTHLTYALTSLYRTQKKYYDLDQYVKLIDDILLRIIKDEKVLEINTRSMLPTDDTYYFHFIIDRYIALGGVDLTLSSDAHSAEMYMYKFDLVIELLKEKGIEQLVIFKNRTKNYVSL